MRAPLQAILVGIGLGIMISSLVFIRGMTTSPQEKNLGVLFTEFSKRLAKIEFRFLPLKSNMTSKNGIQGHTLLATSLQNNGRLPRSPLPAELAPLSASGGSSKNPGSKNDRINVSLEGRTGRKNQMVSTTQRVVNDSFFDTIGRVDNDSFVPFFFGALGTNLTTCLQFADDQHTSVCFPGHVKLNSSAAFLVHTTTTCENTVARVGVHLLRVRGATTLQPVLSVGVGGLVPARPSCLKLRVQVFLREIMYGNAGVIFFDRSVGNATLEFSPNDDPPQGSKCSGLSFVQGNWVGGSWVPFCSPHAMTPSVEPVRANGANKAIGGGGGGSGTGTPMLPPKPSSSDKKAIITRVPRCDTLIQVCHIPHALNPKP